MLKQVLIKLLDKLVNSGYNNMNGINNYGAELSQRQIRKGYHRIAVGGMWETIGKLQFDFLLQHGLKRDSKLLDIGCGALRSGLFFIEYLEKGNYYGIDVNRSLIEAGKTEVLQKGLADKSPNLIVNDSFNASLFNETFDFVLSVSVFTHLYINHIIKCLFEARKCMLATSLFYATFYEAPHSAHVEAITHIPSGKITKYTENPFHYSFEEIKMMAEIAGMEVSYIGKWNHPRDQIMVAFAKKDK